MFKNHPKGLIVLALANMGERFGYYTMLAILAIYMQAKFGFSSGETSLIYGAFLAMVYFLPIFGGLIADKWLGYGKTILVGVSIMFGGYLLLAMPTENNLIGKGLMFLSLFFISAGTGLFKGNLQALVGKLYDKPEYSGSRDIAFSIFYMFINIGAFFAPSMANFINNSVLEKSQFVYDANIPNNYVALNNQEVDKTAYLADFMAENPDFATLPEKKQAQKLKKQKSKDGVIFTEDKTQVLFNLKAAGIYQLSKSGKLVDPAYTLSQQEYALLESRNQEEQQAKEAVIEKINNTPEEALASYFAKEGSTVKPFAERFGTSYVNESLSSSYSYSFGVACISLIISILVFLFWRKTWSEADIKIKKKGEAATASASEQPQMSAQEVRERMTALFLVFFVVIFFWMSFHQNGLCMTFFARDYTMSSITPGQNMLFSLLSLLPIIVFLYGAYLSFIGLFGGNKNQKSGFFLMASGLAAIVAYYFTNVAQSEEIIKITPQIFQQFNPFFIIILTPAVVEIFTRLGQKGKEPSAPRKIGIGMLIAAVGFVVLAVASIGLPDPSSLQGTSDVLVSPNWLIGTYLVLTVAELFLSPMGLSFVSKVAPPQYSGLMQGGWLAATAIGNFLVGVMGMFWEELSLVAFWGVLVVCCLLSAAFIFSVMKRLERVTK